MFKRFLLSDVCLLISFLVASLYSCAYTFLGESLFVRVFFAVGSAILWICFGFFLSERIRRIADERRRTLFPSKTEREDQQKSVSERKGIQE